jgi:hypothetical protein
VSWQAVAAGTAGDGNRDVPAAASLLLGRYRLLSRIGSGRLGLIYAASDTGEPGLE